MPSRSNKVIFKRTVTGIRSARYALGRPQQYQAFKGGRYHQAVHGTSETWSRYEIFQ